MSWDAVPLARQVDAAMQEMGEELKGMFAGTIVFQIRNDAVGKFGIRHLPLDCEDKDRTNVSASEGLTSDQVEKLRRMAVEALVHKKSWTHGEITYDFILKQGKVNLSVQFESNYIERPKPIDFKGFLFLLRPTAHILPTMFC